MPKMPSAAVRNCLVVTPFKRYVPRSMTVRATGAPSMVASRLTGNDAKSGARKIWERLDAGGLITSRRPIGWLPR